MSVIAEIKKLITEVKDKRTPKECEIYYVGSNPGKSEDELIAEFKQNNFIDPNKHHIYIYCPSDGEIREQIKNGTYKAGRKLN